jgi:hypothetical protein
VPQLLTALQVGKGGEVGRMASRLTPSNTPGSRGQDVCAPRLQCRVTDVAVHNDCTQPFYCTIDKQTVSRPGRLPDFNRARKDFHKLRAAEAEATGKRFLVTIYGVSGWLA